MIWRENREVGRAWIILNGDVTVFDTAVCIGNFFVELVSSINQGSHEHECIKVIVVREFDVLIGGSCIELGSGTLRLVQ